MSSEWLWYFSRGAGIVTLVLFTAVLSLGIVTADRGRMPPGRLTTMTAVHRGLALGACMFLVLHVLTALLDTYVSVGWWALAIPFLSAYHPLGVGLGTLAADLAVTVVVTSVLRRRIPEALWRGIHWLAYGMAVAGLAHAVIVASFHAPVLLGVTIACLVMVALAVLLRVFRAIGVEHAAAPNRRPAVSGQEWT